jgi:hypothetical protein
VRLVDGEQADRRLGQQLAEMRLAGALGRDIEQSSAPARKASIVGSR